ncbi:MAG: hypothetical protein KGQ41_06085, partial [Alphaproteobacteria bacterium]|nr:hypothetical protein [Alphaproteobacteria bacterium]
MTAATTRKFTLDMNDRMDFEGSTLFRLVATSDFGDVKAGDKGGYVAHFNNVALDGEAWVDDGAIVKDDTSLILNDARVRKGVVIVNSMLFGKVELKGPQT